jgi:hypothetical protein
LEVIARFSIDEMPCGVGGDDSTRNLGPLAAKLGASRSIGNASDQDGKAIVANQPHVTSILAGPFRFIVNGTGDAAR